MSQEHLQSDLIQNETLLCAGLPFTGTRPLSLSERSALKRNSFRHIIIAFSWLMAIPLSLILPFLIWAGLSLITQNTTLIINLISILFISAILLGIPVAILKARDMLRRARTLNRTVSASNVRCFEGVLDSDDWTDEARGILVRAGLVNIDRKETTRLELHTASDVVYKVNELEPKKWTQIEITIAAPVPVSPARFLVPVEWQKQEAADQLERRRLTEAEREELLGYARRIRKHRWLYLVGAWFGGRALYWFICKAIKLSPDISAVISVAASLVICWWLFSRATLMAKRREQDSEYGWAIVIEPSEPDVSDPGETNLNASIEVLPISEIVWTMRGKPAGWRRLR